MNLPHIRKIQVHPTRYLDSDRPYSGPQKMYAAKSLDNVQAVSEGGNTETHTLYFAVPNSWENYTKVKIHAIIGQSPQDRKYYLLEQLLLCL